EERIGAGHAVLEIDLLLRDLRRDVGRERRAIVAVEEGHDERRMRAETHAERAARATSEVLHVGDRAKAAAFEPAERLAIDGERARGELADLFGAFSRRDDRDTLP